MNHAEYTEFHSQNAAQDAITREREYPCGDYTLTLGHSHEEAKTEGNRIMRANGCERVRFEELEDGRMVVHGYLANEH